MKNIILTLLLFCGFSSYGQIMQTNNTPGGYQWKAMKSDSMTIITHGADTLAIGPAKYGVATIGAIYYKTADSSLWLRSAHKWNQLSGGGGGGLSAGDTVYLHSRLVASYGKNAGNDSTILILNDGTRFAAMDNSGSSVTWGDILGDIHNQTDLINYIDSVFNVAASDSDHLVGVWPIVQTRSNDTIYTALDSTFMTVTLIDGIKSGGFVSWTGTGLVFDRGPVTYVKNGVLYSLGATQITLSTADPTLDRYDVPAVDDTPGSIVLEGDPAAQPQIPQPEPATQLSLNTAILIPAGATTPGVTVETIYDEDIEWTHTTTGTVSFSNTTNPKHLTIAADMSSYAVTRSITFTHTGNLDRLDYTLLKFYIDLKADMPASSNIQVRFYNGTTAVTPALTIAAAHGFSKVDVGYQTITVPLSSLAFSSNTFTRIVWSFTVAGSGLYFDWAQLQGGIDPGGPTTGVTNFIYTNTYGLTGTVTNPTTTPNLRILLDTSLIATHTFFYNKIDSLVLTLQPKLNGTGYVKMSGTTVAYRSNAQLTTDVNNFTTVLSGAVPAPTTVNGYFLRDDGTWASVGGAVTPSALSKADDTNVTLTLTGTPLTSLLQPVTVTAGWTGTLGVARGGTANSSFTAYSPIFAGTTSTGAFQSSTLGASGTVLTSTGTGSLPTWQTNLGWITTGNAGTTTPTNFIGTTDANGFNIRTNNIVRFIIDSSGESLPPAVTEQFTASNWTSTNWTGSWATGWTHTTGNTTALTRTGAAVVGTAYYLSWSMTGRTAGTVTLSFGGASTIAASTSGEFAFNASTTGTFSATPTSTFDGTLFLSLKLMSGSSIALAEIKASNVNGTQIQFRGDTAVNLGIGFEALGRTVAGYGGTVNRNTGLYNTAVGYKALNLNTSGTYNTAIGYNTLVANTTGYNNMAFGGGALTRNTTGSSNIGIGNGADQTTTGSKTVFIIGEFSGAANSTSSDQVMIAGDLTGIGDAANRIVISGGGVSFPTARPAGCTEVGILGGAQNTGTELTAFGYKAASGIGTGGTSTASNDATAIGVRTMGAVGGTKNTALGFEAMWDGSRNSNNNTTGDGNIGIGYRAMGGRTAGSYNTAIGYNIGLMSNTGSDQFALGGNAIRWMISDLSGGSSTRRFEFNGTATDITATRASVALGITSTTGGFAPPAMTTTQKNAISSPAEGLVIYDLTLHKLCVYTGSAWETITSL